MIKISWEKLEQEWRKQLLSYANGDVLEVGVGRGDNFKYYPTGVHVTATDMSARAIEKAKVEARSRRVATTFHVSTMEGLELKDKAFDTVVSTFSLCAYDHPLQILKQFNQWCKPDGTILLLEYGLSKCQLINWLQRKWDHHHYKRTGYHLNLDMFSLIADSNLRVKKMEAKYAGIIYLVWASLKPMTEKELQNSFLKNTG